MTGKFLIVGVGPGDPDLMTVKAAREIALASVVASFAASDRPGRALTTAEHHINLDAQRLTFTYPFTLSIDVRDARYHQDMHCFYDQCADKLKAILLEGQSVVLLCEGDPFLYGSAMYLHDRLAGRFPCEVVPGISGMSGCWSAANMPMVHGDDVLSVVPCTLAEPELRNIVGTGDGLVLMKLGRNLHKLRRVLEDANRAEQAIYVEHGSCPQQRVLPFRQAPAQAPYFSMVLVPGRRRQR